MGVALAAFATLGPVFPPPVGTPAHPITWTYGSPTANPGHEISHAITDSAQRAQVEAAIRAWATETGLNFKQVPDTVAAKPDIVIAYGKFGSPRTGIAGQTNYSWSGAIGGPKHFNPGTIVRVEDPAEAPLTVNPDGSMWYQGLVSVSLKQDVMHEFGHALGLASHPTDHEAVMYDGLGASNQNLDPNDIAAVASLYPYVKAPGTDLLLSSKGELSSHHSLSSPAPPPSPTPNPSSP